MIFNITIADNNTEDLNLGQEGSGEFLILMTCHDIYSDNHAVRTIICTWLEELDGCLPRLIN